MDASQVLESNAWCAIRISQKAREQLKYLAIYEKAPVAAVRHVAEIVRQKGSHAFWQHEDGRATIVPIHKGEDIGRGLLRQILRDVGIDLDEFARLRRK